MALLTLRDSFEPPVEDSPGAMEGRIAIVLSMVTFLMLGAGGAGVGMLAAEGGGGGTAMTGPDRLAGGDWGRPTAYVARPRIGMGPWM